ncbi:MAG: GNVR domain-containing protein [Desulfuromonadaceae bacterium]
MDSPIAQIKRYLHVLYCRRHLFLLVAASVAFFIVLGSFFIPKKYEAKSTVFIEENVVSSLMKGITVSPSMVDRIRVLRYHMLSRDIILRVLKKLNKDAELETSEDLEALVRVCQEKTQINVRETDLFFVSFVDQDPTFAKNFINTLVNTYVEENLSEKREESFGANRFLSEQVEFYKDKLNKIEDEIYNFRKKTGIFSTVTEATLIEEMKNYNDELQVVKSKKVELNASLSTIKEQIKMMKEMPSSSGGSIFDIAEISGDGRIEALKAQLEELLLIYNDQYPTVVKLKEQIAELEKKQKEQETLEPGQQDQDFAPIEDPIFVDLKMRLNLTQSNLNALVAQESDLLERIANNKKILENFPQEKKVLAGMERERTMTQNVYETLLQRVGVSEVSKQMEVSDKATTFRIVDPAIQPTVPVGLKRIYKMFFGLIVGFGLGIGAVFLREKLDDTVKDSDMLRSLGITVLAEIPLMFDQLEVFKQRKMDKLVYSYSGVCMLFIAIMIGHDLLGLTLVDQLIFHFRLDTLVADLTALVQ